MPDSLSLIASIWTAYGLQDDPYFQMPLEPSNDPAAERPATLHVGRQRELNTVASRVLSDANSRSLIHGPPGVGKTSFISKLKATLRSHHVLMHAEPVRVQAGMTPRHFLAEVLKVLLQIHATEVAVNGWLDGVAAQFRIPKREKEFWVRLRRIIHGEDTQGAGGSAGFIGGQLEPVRIAGEIPSLSLFDEVGQALAYLSRKGAFRVLIHVNNLESLGGADLAKAARLMQQVRDVFLAPCGHWLFVGTTEIEDGIFRVHSQVSSIIPPSTALAPLTADEVTDVIRRRYRHLQRGLHMMEPIEAEQAGALFARYRGDLRKFLTLTSEGVRQHALISPGEPITMGELIESLADHHWTQTVLKRISPQDADHLRTALAGERFDVQFHAAEIKRRVGTISQPTASALIRRLEQAQIIEFTRRQGRSVFYRVADGDIAVALRML